jgi:hypothetical protein
MTPMADCQVTWNKKQRERAKVEGKTLFAVAHDGKVCRAETTGLMDEAKARLLFRFARNLYEGQEPPAALAGALDTPEPAP